jgi:hypothetical protein
LSAWAVITVLVDHHKIIKKQQKKLHKQNSIGSHYFIDSIILLFVLLDSKENEPHERERLREKINP